MPGRLVHDGVVGLHRGRHPFGTILPLLTCDVSERGYIRVEKYVGFLGAARNVIAEVAGIGQDAPDSRFGPGVTRPVRVSGPVVGRWAGHPLAGEHRRDVLVARPSQKHVIDALHDRRRLGVHFELVEPST